MIAPYITEAEYRCQHCGKYPPDFVRDSDGKWPRPFQDLFDKFKVLREIYFVRLGRAIPITSGYRCPVRELQVSGSAMTVHMFGLALDCGVMVGEEMNALLEIIEDTFPLLRVGKNEQNGHVHIDNGYLIYPRWDLKLSTGARWVE